MLLKIVARLDNDMTTFVNVLKDPKATCIHRCQMGFMYFVCLICFMMIVVAGPLQLFGQVPAMQCLPWWMGYGNHEACLKWHSSKCPFGCATSTETCSGHVGGDTSNTFNINDIYYDGAAAKLLAPSIRYIWRDVEGRTAPMPKAIMFTKFSAMTTLVFCEHVKVSPSSWGMLGADRGHAKSASWPLCTPPSTAWDSEKRVKARKRWLLRASYDTSTT